MSVAFPFFKASLLFFIADTEILAAIVIVIKNGILSRNGSYHLANKRVTGGNPRAEPVLGAKPLLTAVAEVIGRARALPWLPFER